MSDETTNDETIDEQAGEEPVAEQSEAVAEQAAAPEDDPMAEAEAEPDAAPEVEAPAELEASSGEESGPQADADADVDPDAAAEVDVPAASGEVSDEEAAAVTKKRKRLPRSQRPQKTRRKREPATTRKPIVRLEKPGSDRGRRQERQGTVVSDAMEKTIVVKVDVIKAHPKYKKVVRRSTKFHAHDERNEAKVGDVVRIVETRPISKSKRWRLAEVLEVAK